MSNLSLIDQDFFNKLRQQSIWGGNFYYKLKNGKKIRLAKAGDLIADFDFKKFENSECYFEEVESLVVQKNLKLKLEELKVAQGSYLKNKICDNIQFQIKQCFQEQRSVLDFQKTLTDFFDIKPEKSFKSFYEQNSSLYHRSMIVASMSVLSACVEGYYDITFLKQTFLDIMEYGEKFSKEQINYVKLQSLDNKEKELTEENFPFPYLSFTSNWQSLCLFFHYYLNLNDFNYEKGDILNLFEQVTNKIDKAKVFGSSKHAMFWQSILESELKVAA